MRETRRSPPLSALDREVHRSRYISTNAIDISSSSQPCKVYLLLIRRRDQIAACIVLVAAGSAFRLR